MSSDEKSLGDRVRDKAEKRDRRERSKDVKSAIEEANFQLYRDEPGSHVIVANLCRDILIPEILPNGFDDIAHYQQTEVADEPGWDWTSIEQFHRNPNAWIDRLAHQPDWARDVIEGAFQSVEEVAEFDGIVKGTMRNYADAMGYTRPLGKHMQSYEMDLGEQVEIVEDDKGALKSLFGGSTGEGKSSTMNAEAEDAHRSGRKNIDLVDFKEGENVVQDMPQQQADLRRIREDAGLEPDFEAAGEPAPNLDVWIPLHPGLDEERLTYDTDEGEFEASVFTIPLADIPKDVMIKLLSANASEQQETAVRHAYQDVTLENNDFSLKDISEEIKQKDDLEDKFQSRIIRLLDSLHRMGFIRTRDCPYAIDLEELMRDTESFTSFTQMYMDTKAQKLMVVLCLLGLIRDIRDDAHDLPRMHLSLRELHKVAPHNKRESFDRNAAAIQSTIGILLGEVVRENRHNGIEVACDTQTIGDIKMNVRTEFNRAVVFSPGAVFDIADEMKDVRNNVAGACAAAMRTKAGFGAIIGNAATINDQKGIHFLAPIKFHPPSWHHFDADGPHGTGWNTRVHYFDHLEFRRPTNVDGVSWPCDPEDGIDRHNLDPEGYEAEKNPMGAFVEQHIIETGDEADYVPTAVVRELYNEFAEDVGGEQYEDAQDFGYEFGDYADLVRKNDRRTYPKDGEQCYFGVKLSEDTAERLAEQEDDEDVLDEAGEPIDTSR